MKQCLQALIVTVINQKDWMHTTENINSRSLNDLAHPQLDRGRTYWPGLYPWDLTGQERWCGYFWNTPARHDSVWILNASSWCCMTKTGWDFCGCTIPTAVLQQEVVLNVWWLFSKLMALGYFSIHVEATQDLSSSSKPLWSERSRFLLLLWGLCKQVMSLIRPLARRTRCQAPEPSSSPTGPMCSLTSMFTGIILLIIGKTSRGKLLSSQSTCELSWRAGDHYWTHT